MIIFLTFLIMLIYPFAVLVIGIALSNHAERQTQHLKKARESLMLIEAKSSVYFNDPKMIEIRKEAKKGLNIK